MEFRFLNDENKHHQSLQYPKQLTDKDFFSQVYRTVYRTDTR